MNELSWKVHHIAYAVRDTDLAIKQFKFLYTKIEHYKVIEESQNIFFTYLTDEIGTMRIELVEGFNENSPVEKLVGDSEVVLYHVCYEVNDFSEAYKNLRQRGFIVVTKPFVPLFNSQIKVCHMYNTVTGIIEIIGPNIG